MKLLGIIKNTLPFLILVAMCSSCNKLLDITPTDIIDAQKALVTMKDIRDAAAGAYSTMSNTSIQYKTAGNADIALSTWMSDENYLPMENISGNGANIHRWLINPDDQNTWVNWGSSVVTSNPVIFTGSNYAVIDRINRILRVIDDIPTLSTEDRVDKPRIKGELLALRAHCHFQILKSYSENYEPQALGVPYMHFINDAPGEVKPARLTVAETFAKIEHDLAEAKSLIPANFTDVTRINSRAVSAIQARVFLFEKKWGNAIQSATEVIQSIPLVDTIQFRKMWADSSNAEIAWKLKKDIDNDKIGQLYRTTTAVEFAAFPKLRQAFDYNNDGRYKIYIEYNTTRGNNKTPYLVNKYNLNKTTTGLADIKLYRVAEMYLIRAESYAELQSSLPDALHSASTDLTTLRKARMKHYNHFEYTTKDDLINEVYLERFKELAFEGHRYFDLRRRALPIKRAPLATDDNSGFTNSTAELKPSQQAYYLPIPGFELRANDNMVQNPIYR